MSITFLRDLLADTELTVLKAVYLRKGFDMRMFSCSCLEHVVVLLGKMSRNVETDHRSVNIYRVKINTNVCMWSKYVDISTTRQCLII